MDRKKQIKQNTQAVDTEKLRQQTEQIKYDTNMGASDDETLKRSKTTFRIMASLLFASFLMVGLLIYWAVFPYDVLDIKSPVPVQEKTVKRGEIAHLIVDYCKSTDSPGTIVRFLVSDRIEYRLPEQFDDQEARCLEDQLVPILIPSEIQPDTYHVRYRVSYKVNPVKEVEEVFASESFIVTE